MKSLTDQPTDQQTSSTISVWGVWHDIDGPHFLNIEDGEEFQDMWDCFLKGGDTDGYFD